MAAVSELRALLGDRFQVTGVWRTGLGVAELINIPLLLLCHRVLHAPRLYQALQYIYFTAYLAEDTLPESTLLPLVDADGPPSRQRQATRLRLVSVFRQGWIAILVALINQRRLPRGRFIPEPWPQSAIDHPPRDDAEMLLAA